MTRGPAPRGILGMLALIVVVESLLAAHAHDFTRFTIDDWKVSGRAARREATSCEVLCLGDSLVKFGVMPDILEDRLGTRAYNLAVCDGQAPSSYFLLRRALESGARPSVVVIDAVPHLLAADPRHNLRQWPELFSPREGIDIGWTSKHARFCAELALGMLLPSFKDRFEIRGNLLMAFRGETGSHRDEFPAFRRHWHQNQGAMVFPDRPSYRGEIDATNPAYFPRAWKCHPVNVVYLHRLLDLATSHAIEVCWLLPPVAPRFQARRDQLGLETAIEHFLHDLQSRYANLTVIDGRRLGYGHELFIDPLHLNRRGAMVLSAGIAAVLDAERHAPATASWIPIPDYRASRIRARFEDIDQSRLAVDLPAAPDRR